MHFRMGGNRHFLASWPHDVGRVHVALELVRRIVGKIVGVRKSHAVSVHSIAMPVEALRE
jgi:hypothetical protein